MAQKWGFSRTVWKLVITFWWNFTDWPNRGRWIRILVPRNEIRAEFEKSKLKNTNLKLGYQFGQRILSSRLRSTSSPMVIWDPGGAFQLWDSPSFPFYCWLLRPHICLGLFNPLRAVRRGWFCCASVLEAFFRMNHLLECIFMTWGTFWDHFWPLGVTLGPLLG